MTHMKGNPFELEIAKIQTQTNDCVSEIRNRVYECMYSYVVRLMPKGINILVSYCLFLSLSLSISLSLSLSNFSNTAFQTGITPN